MEFYHDFGTRVESGSDLEEEEAGWDSPLTQLENDLQPAARYFSPNRSFKIVLLDIKNLTIENKSFRDCPFNFCLFYRQFIILLKILLVNYHYDNLIKKRPHNKITDHHYTNSIRRS